MRVLATLLLLSPPALADLPLPFPAERTLLETLPLSSHRVATGPFDGTLPHVVAEGPLVREVWRMAAPGATSLQVLDPVRAALTSDGWEVAFDCRARACGGFDFRFEIDVAPAPEMFVDLADYRYAALRRGEAWRTLVASTSGDAAFLQVVTVDPDGAAAAPIPEAAGPAIGPLIGSDVAAALAMRGRAVLGDLEFATGSTALTGDYASLRDLAAFLRTNPEVTVALVGHTDAEGGAEGNIAISRRRAEAARALLIERHGIAPARIETHGVGFFAPLARNDTEAGREANRRVEVVVTSTP